LTNLIKEYEDLYRDIPLAGEPLTLLVAPFDIEYGAPADEEIEDAVGWLKMGKAVGPSSMRSEHLKE
jgi:hypothetical protein